MDVGSECICEALIAWQWSLQALRLISSSLSCEEDGFACGKVLISSFAKLFNKYLGIV